MRNELENDALNPAKCSDLDYINFLIASVGVFSCTEAARCQVARANNPSHDAFTRLLRRQPPDTEALWDEVKWVIQPHECFLVIDDTTLDKPYAEKNDLVYRLWSGKHHRVVDGINITTLLWTDGTPIIPVDFRVYDKNSDGKSKNNHFRDMLNKAKERGFMPGFILFDSWYSGIDNLKEIRKLKWHWLTRLKKNRLVNPDDTKNVPIDEVEIHPEGRIVHLKAYGFIKVFKIVSDDGDVEYWATDLTDMEETKRKMLSKHSWKIEEYHRGLKQFCGVERCQARKSQSQIAHISFSIRAFLRLELIRLIRGISWFESKRKVIRNAISAYREHPDFLWFVGSTA
jgi:putative transposase